MATFTVSAATEEDLPSIATISRAAFRNSPHTMSYWMFPQDNEEGIYRWRLNGIVNRFHNDPTTYLCKCVDNVTGRIVSYALWQRPYPRKTQEEHDSQEAVPKEGKTGVDEMLPEGTNVPLMNDFDQETMKMRRKYVDTNQDYSEYDSFPCALIVSTLGLSLNLNQVLRALATLPEYQGKGCGSILLESGLEDIDKQLAKVFLEATPQGRPLYAKYGWKLVDEMVFDLAPYGCPGVQTITCMMRERRLV